MNGVYRLFDKKFPALIGLGVAFLSGISAHADTVALNPVADNTLYESTNGALSGGADGVFFAGQSDDLRILRAVLRFDIAGSVPSGATITSAVLRVNLNDNNTGAPRLANVHRLLQSWGEGASTSAQDGLGGASAAGDATWIHRFYSTSTWDTAGGSYSNVESASQFVQDPGAYDFSSASILNDVQNWLDAAPTNFGWLIKVSIESFGTLRFDSRESGTPSARPTLTIGYVAGSSSNPPPEFVGFSRSATGFSNAWAAVSGQVYQVDYITNTLAPVTWIPLGSVTATTTTASMTDTNAGRFRLYRVLHLQF